MSTDAHRTAQRPTGADDEDKRIGFCANERPSPSVQGVMIEIERFQSRRGEIRIVRSKKQSVGHVRRTRHPMVADRPSFLKILERPDISLHTNGSENDIRGVVKSSQSVTGKRVEKLLQRCSDARTKSLNRERKNAGIERGHVAADTSTKTPGEVRNGIRLSRRQSEGSVEQSWSSFGKKSKPNIRNRAISV